MTRSFQALVLLLAFLVQAVIASPSNATDPTMSGHALAPTPCRCCSCGGMACCAPAPEPAPATPFRATPARAVGTEDLLTPPAPFAPAFSALFFSFPTASPRPASFGRAPSAVAPSFLLGGGLLI